MEVIPSFQIDHSNLQPGVYVSRKDTYGNVCFTTYDIRMTAPNREPALQPSAMHTIEHLVATYLRNREDWKRNIIYWGPMGCMTGSYLIVNGSYPCAQIRDLMIDAFTFVKDFEGDVPGAAPDECGNWLLHDLPMARWEAARYVKRLIEDFHSEYPHK